jgi:hypothetical protein
MNWTKLSVATAMAAALIAVPATVVTAVPVYADAFPSPDEVAAAMAELTDPAANKNNIVSPGFSPDEAGTINDHLNEMNAKGALPLNFVVTDIQSAPNGLAGATVATTGGYLHRNSPQPIVLTDQGGHWLDHPRHCNYRAGRLLQHRATPLHLRRATWGAPQL